MSLKATDVFQTTGKELPISVVNPKGGKELRYTDVGDKIVAGEWPNWKQTIAGALEDGLIEPFGSAVAQEVNVEDSVVAE